MRFLHVVAGLLGLASGAVALYAFKGAKLHRLSGMIFVYSMLFLSASGAGMAALKSQRVNTIAGVLTFYLVTTALLTVRRSVMSPSWIDAGALLVALTLGIVSVRLGVEALHSGAGQIDSYPPALVFLFGAVALLAALGDIRMLRKRGLEGSRRLARHLWRMCCALLIAINSSFLGQPKVFPKPLRDAALQATPVLLVSAVMLYWLARVLFAQRRILVPQRLIRVDVSQALRSE